MSFSANWSHPFISCGVKICLWIFCCWGSLSSIPNLSLLCFFKVRSFLSPNFYKIFILILQDSQIEVSSYSLFIPPFYLILCHFSHLSIQTSIHRHPHSRSITSKIPIFWCSSRSTSNLYITGFLSLFFFIHINFSLLNFHSPFHYLVPLSRSHLQKLHLNFHFNGLLPLLLDFLCVSLDFVSNPLPILYPNGWKQRNSQQSCHFPGGFLTFYPVDLQFKAFSENFHQTPLICTQMSWFV